MSQCCICEKRILTGGWLCHGCAGAYGLADLPFQDWPDWAKFLANQEHRERRQAYYERNWVGYDDLMDTLELGDEDALRRLMQEPLITRAEGIGHEGNPDWMPTAPYDDEELNEQYRASNHIRI